MSSYLGDSFASTVTTIPQAPWHQERLQTSSYEHQGLTRGLVTADIESRALKSTKLGYAMENITKTMKDSMKLVQVGCYVLLASCIHHVLSRYFLATRTPSR